MDVFAWVISRVSKCVSIFLVRSSSHAVKALRGMRTRMNVKQHDWQTGPP